MADIVFPKPSASEASSKIDKVQDAVVGNIAALGADGSLVDSGKTIEKSVPSNAVFTDTTYSFSNNNPTLSWNTTSTIGTVGGTALTVQMPPNPDTNTTYSFTNNSPTLAWNTTSTIGVCGGVALTAKLPANPNTDHYAWSDITSKPDTATRWPAWSEVTSKPSTFPPESHTHSYLPLTGGTLKGSNDTPLYIQSGNSDSAFIGFKQDDGTLNGYLYITDTKKAGVYYSSAYHHFALEAEAIKNITRSGTTFTATRCNGTTFTFTQQDNDHYAWSNITGKPSTYPPEAHTHSYITTTGKAEDDCVPANDTFQAFRCTSSTTGGGDGYIWAQRWSGGNYVTQIYTEVDASYLMCYRFKKNADSTWGAWKRIPMGDGTGASGTWGINISGNATTATSAGNADTVDNEHASAFAHTGAHNNLTASGNEFTTASSGFSGEYFWNYRTAGGTNGNITKYNFCNGKGGTLAYISNGQFSGNAASASSVAWSNVSGRPSIINNLTSTSTTDALSAKQGSVLLSLIPGIETMTIGPGAHATMPWSGSSNQAAIVFWYHSSAALNPQAIWMNSTVHIYNMSGIDCGTITMDSTTFVNGTDYWLYVIFFNLKHGGG